MLFAGWRSEGRREAAAAAQGEAMNYRYQILAKWKESEHQEEFVGEFPTWAAASQAMFDYLKAHEKEFERSQELRMRLVGRVS